MTAMGRQLAAALVTVCVLGAANLSATGATVSPADIAARRQEILDAMLTDKYEAAWIARLRRLCAVGGEPASVAEDRGAGTYFTPDAADSCVAALTRTGHDGQLSTFYRTFMTELGGDVQASDRLPRAIGAAVLADAAKVPIGNGKAATITPALAFDAGFTAAYQEGPASRPPAADARQLKPIAEACLAQRQDAGTCFSGGYVYGARAFAARTASR